MSILNLLPQVSKLLGFCKGILCDAQETFVSPTSNWKWTHSTNPWTSIHFFNVPKGLALQISTSHLFSPPFDCSWLAWLSAQGPSNPAVVRESQLLWLCEMNVWSCLTHIYIYIWYMCVYICINMYYSIDYWFVLYRSTAAPQMNTDGWHPHFGAPVSQLPATLHVDIVVTRLYYSADNHICTRLSLSLRD